MKKAIIITGISLVGVFVLLRLIPTSIQAAEMGSLTQKYLLTHPKKRDKSGKGKAPLPAIAQHPCAC